MTPFTLIITNYEFFETDYFLLHRDILNGYAQHRFPIQKKPDKNRTGSAFRIYYNYIHR